MPAVFGSLALAAAPCEIAPALFPMSSGDVQEATHQTLMTVREMQRFHIEASRHLHLRLPRAIGAASIHLHSTRSSTPATTKRVGVAGARTIHYVHPRATRAGSSTIARIRTTVPRRSHAGHTPRRLGPEWRASTCMRLREGKRLLQTPRFDNSVAIRPLSVEAIDERVASGSPVVCQRHFRARIG